MADKRDWCFTWNATSDQSDEDLIEAFEEAAKASLVPKAQYLIGGLEHGEETGRPHIQGFVQFKTKVNLGDLKKVNRRVHWEPRRGSVQEADVYCRKEGTIVFYHGTSVARADKMKVMDLIECIRNGEDISDPKFDLMKMLYGKKVQQLYDEVHPDQPISFKPQAFWFYGKTGTGKTRTVRQTEPSLYVWEYNTPFQGYANEEAILIDDLRTKGIAFDELLRILDWSSTKVNRKFQSATYLKAKRIYVTSDRHPSEVYSGCGDIEQLIRRLDGGIIRYPIN